MAIGNQKTTVIIVLFPLFSIIFVLTNSLYVSFVGWKGGSELFLGVIENKQIEKNVKRMSLMMILLYKMTNERG